MHYKDGKWAREIFALQHDDGTWGRCFHTLSQPTKDNPLTMEQALRRLHVLGFTMEDEPIRRAVTCMTACLEGAREIDSYSEKKHDWALFTKLMLSTWVKIFDPENEVALAFSRQWAYIAEGAFRDGNHDPERHKMAFREQFGRNPNPASSFENDFHMLYHAYLLQGVLIPETERKLLAYYLALPDGIYYVNSGPLHMLPQVFASKKTSFYLAGLEILAGYPSAGEQLGFAVEWLNAHKDENGQWDLGANAKDGIYFPLSDSWRKAEDRKADCTERIQALLRKLV